MEKKDYESESTRGRSMRTDYFENQGPSEMAFSEESPQKRDRAKKRGRTQKTETPARTREDVICDLCPCEEKPAEKVVPNVDRDSAGRLEIYRLVTSQAGFLHCSATDLIFEVTEAATITYHVDSWYKHLKREKTEQFIIAGPLFNIEADPVEAVAAVHFPHFLCLAGGDHSGIRIAHFSEGALSLDHPDSVSPFHAVLKNPTFSLRGVILKHLNKWKRNIHAVALLYHLDTPGRSAHTFHLYLLPNCPCLKKAVNDLERGYNSRRVPKPPVTCKALRIGSRFFVQKSDDISVTPMEYILEYLDPDMEQQYFEVYAEGMRDKLTLKLMEKQFKEDEDKPVWEACVRQDDLLRSAPPQPECTFPDQDQNPACISQDVHFIEHHRDELIQRTTTVDGVLDQLHNNVLNEEQYQRIASKATNPEKMRELYRLVPGWDLACKERLYQALRDKNKFLIKDLEGR